MKRSRRNHTPAFKAKVAVAALKGDQTVAEVDVRVNGVVKSTDRRKPHVV